VEESFEAFVARLKENSMKIETSQIEVPMHSKSGREIGVRVIKPKEMHVIGYERNIVEDVLRDAVEELINGKQYVFVRVFPEVTERFTYDGEPDGYNGYARIAAWSDDE
jgi:hypothetical protein